LDCVVAVKFDDFVVAFVDDIVEIDVVVVEIN
jgi:hypothetical protein